MSYFPISSELPPFNIPKSLWNACVIPALRADWADAVAFSDHWTFIRAARNGEAPITLTLSGGVDLTTGGTTTPYSGSDDYDSEVRTRMQTGAGGVLNRWFSPPGFPQQLGITMLFHRSAGEIRLASDGFLLLEVHSSPSIQVLFSFSPASIAAAITGDIVSSFDFFGATIPFRAQAITFGTLTAASITASA